MTLIDRQAAIDALWKALYAYEDKKEKQFQESEDLDIQDWIQHRIFVQNMSDIDRQTILDLPPVQPKQTNCEYCHTDRDGYVFPLEKNSHAFIDRDKIVLKAKGWRGEAKIKYCPICGRRLTDG